MKQFLTAGVLATAAATAQAQAAPPAPQPCGTAEHRQFDFWIGEWDVFDPKGKQVGRNRVELHGAGCYLLENWSGASGFDGKSLNMYDQADRKWHQSWYDSSGTRLALVGGLVDGKMVLSSSDGTQRITWTPNADGSVRQHWESSKDMGKTFATAFDGRYVKRK
jgi:hypothetical protein